MSDPALIVEQRGPVRWLTLNRPAQRNALNDAIADALDAQVADIESDPETAVVVLRGEGKSFSAGGDFRYFLELSEEAAVRGFLTHLSAVVTRIEQSSKPWIAALHCHAIAGGLELALACDVVIAAEGTLIGDGHVNNKLMPGAGSSVRLERAIGKGPARWLHLSGQTETAEELARTGWLHDVVAPDRLRARAQEVAEELSAKDSATQRNLKSLLTEIAELDDETALDKELEVFASHWTENDVAEALHRFLSTRTTVRTGEATA